MKASLSVVYDEFCNNTKTIIPDSSHQLKTMELEELDQIISNNFNDSMEVRKHYNVDLERKGHITITYITGQAETKRLKVYYKPNIEKLNLKKNVKKIKEMCITNFNNHGRLNIFKYILDNYPHSAFAISQYNWALKSNSKTSIEDAVKALLEPLLKNKEHYFFIRQISREIDKRLEEQKKEERRVISSLVLNTDVLEEIDASRLIKNDYFKGIAINEEEMYQEYSLDDLVKFHNESLKEEKLRGRGGK
ncbi:MAG: hypothetical protein RSF67_07160 [Clostridia bacterium]